MAEEELPIAIVIPGRTNQRASSGEAALLVAGLAEFARIVARGAELPGVCSVPQFDEALWEA